MGAGITCLAGNRDITSYYRTLNNQQLFFHHLFLLLLLTAARARRLPPGNAGAGTQRVRLRTHDGRRPGQGLPVRQPLDGLAAAVLPRRGLIKYGGPAYKEWAEAQNNKIKNILNSARADHTEAVKGRIEDVKQMGSVVEITKNLFEVSKETAKLEAEAFELEQKTALAAEAKSVLESWVRYESQVKQRQQKELAQSVIAKVQKELENPKVLQQILQQSVADIEKIVAAKQ